MLKPEDSGRRSEMAVTATDLTREHYLRAEVKEIITKFAMPGDGAWRALNGDFSWWYARAEEDARLMNFVMDYETITKSCRVLYQTLNVFDRIIWMQFRPREEITPDNPIGTPADTDAYTLGCDIDKGPGCDIETPEVKEAVEAAASFMVDDLKKNGVHDSVWVLFSGGGIYVQTHHAICKPNTVEGRSKFFEMATDCFNAYIVSISEEFFKLHPEYIGKVKFDALNNSKRIFKSILSIHKKKPFAVTPLNRDAIKIDFDRARVPLKDDMLAEARTWYSTFNPAERDPLLRILDTFQTAEEEQTRERKERKKRSGGRFAEIYTSSFKVELKYFPPCITNIIFNANTGEGKTRFTAVLSTFLYQMGWDEDEAWTLIKGISDRNGVGDAAHIFDSCFGRIN